MVNTKLRDAILRKRHRLDALPSPYQEEGPTLAIVRSIVKEVLRDVMAELRGDLVQEAREVAATIVASMQDELRGVPGKDAQVDINALARQAAALVSLPSLEQIASKVKIKAPQVDLEPLYGRLTSLISKNDLENFGRTLKEEILSSFEEEPEEEKSEPVAGSVNIENINGLTELLNKKDAETQRALRDLGRRLTVHGGGSSNASGLSLLVATGTVDDTNVTFTFASTPTLVVVNGATYRNGHGCTINTTTVTLDNPVGTGGDIYGLG